jgi:hypothetical protein
MALLLREWEVWAAELLESHLSHAQLAYFRSQHDNTSWLASLTAILDACSLVLSGVDGAPVRQTQLTFAIARHAAVDLCQVFNLRPAGCDRLPPEERERLHERLESSGIMKRAGGKGAEKLTYLRNSYEPYVCAMASRLLMPLPPWVPAPDAQDDWSATAWEGPEGAAHF